MIEKSIKTVRSKWHGDIKAMNVNIEAKVNEQDLYAKSMMSFTSNQALIAQGTAEMTSSYSYFKAVHSLLNIRAIDERTHGFVRLGRNYDGGYVVVSGREDDSLSESRIAYSLGICDDVSFDLALAKRGYEVFQYDHTIDALPENNEHFHWRKTGVTGKRETGRLKSLETILRSDGNSDKSGMFLKCDIEGSEWAMLADCGSDTLRRFDQIVIEFHELLSFRKRGIILKALKKLSETHETVYIHPNNNSYVDYSGLLITPDVLEATFVLKDKYRTAPADIVLPTALDQPCSPYLIDIRLGKWNI